MSSDFPFEKALVRIRAGPRGTAGTGVVLSREHVLTCAHVIKKALNCTDQPSPDKTVHLSVDAVDTNRTLGAFVPKNGWFPDIELQRLPEASVDQLRQRDIAILRLHDPLPEGTRVMILSSLGDREQRFIAQGFPGGIARIARGRVSPESQYRDRQIQWDADSGAIVGGFSGSAVWSEDIGAMIGLIFESNTGSDRVAHIRPCADLLHVLSGVGITARQRRRPIVLQERIAREHLWYVDHQPQFRMFTEQVDNVRATRDRRPVICMTSADERMQAENLLYRAGRDQVLARFAGRLKKLDPRPLEWPRAAGGMSLDQRRFNILVQLAEELGLVDADPDPSWDGLEAAIKDNASRLGAASAFLLAMSGADLDADGTILLEEWLAFWHRIGSHRLPWQPLLFHAVLEPLPGDDAVRWFAGLQDEQAAGKWPGLRFIRLPAWEAVAEDDIRNWFTNRVGTYHRRLTALADILASDVLDHLRYEGGPVVYVGTCAQALEYMNLLHEAR